MKKIKTTVSTIITFILIWVSHFETSILLPSDNIYLNDSWLFFYPLLIVTIFSIIFFKLKKKDVAIGIIVGGLIYYFGIFFQLVDYMFVKKKIY